MTIQRMLELLEIEHECMLRGSHDDCDRNCADCELVQDDGDLHEMYTDIIAMLKMQEAVKIKVRKINASGRCGRCPSCGNELNEMDYPNYCGFCGRAVTWND